MKKMLFYIIVIIFSFFWCFNCVSASTTYNLNYDITSVEISGDNILMDGWSFIDHVDNYGGNNLKTYIIAYIGSWSDYYVNSRQNYQAGRFYRFSTSYRYKDFYAGRCNGLGCTDKSPGIDSYRLRRLATGQEKYSAYCGGETYNYNGKTLGSNDGHCVYYNVGFHASISLRDLMDTFKSSFVGIDTAVSTNIKFEIVSQVTYGSNNTITRALNLGFHKSACKGYVFSSNGGCPSYNISKTIDLGHTIEDTEGTYTLDSLTITGLEGGFHLTAVSGVVKTGYNYYNMDHDKTTYWFNGKQITGKAYDTGVYSITTDTRYNDKISRYDLMKKIQRDYYVVNCSYVNSGTCGNRKCGAVPGTGKFCYMPTDWGYVTGQFQITVTFKPAKNSCTCFGSNCPKYIRSAEDIKKYCTPRGIVDSTSVRNWSGNECRDYDNIVASANKTTHGNFYYNISKNALFEALKKDKVADIPSDATNFVLYESSDVRLNESKTEALLRLDFAVDITYAQSGSLSTYHESTWSGKKFVNNTLNIDTSRSFAFAMLYDTSVEASNPTNRRYRNYADVEFSFYNPSERRTVLHTSSGSGAVRVFFDLSNADEIIFINRDYGYRWDRIYPGGVDARILYSIDWNSTDKNLNQSLNGSFPDSNDKNRTVTDSEDGATRISDFKKVDGSMETLSNGFRIKYLYTVRQAYYDKKDDSVYYGVGSYDSLYPKLRPCDDSSHCGGSIYFVPKNMNTDEIFVFRIFTTGVQDGDNLSLIPNTTITYNASCSLTVTNQLKDNLRYRPINVKNPFPKANKSVLSSYPKNWQKYIERNGLGRIENTFQQFPNGWSYKMNDFLTVNRFNGIDNDIGYNSFDDVELNGSSSFISSSGLFNTGVREYCALGKYNDVISKCQ